MVGRIKTKSMDREVQNGREELRLKVFTGKFRMVGKN